MSIETLDKCCSQQQQKEKIGAVLAVSVDTARAAVNWVLQKASVSDRELSVKKSLSIGPWTECYKKPQYRTMNWVLQKGSVSDRELSVTKSLSIGPWTECYKKPQYRTVNWVLQKASVSDCGLSVTQTFSIGLRTECHTNPQTWTQYWKSSTVFLSATLFLLRKWTSEVFTAEVNGRSFHCGSERQKFSLRKWTSEVFTAEVHGRNLSIAY